MTTEHFANQPTGQPSPNRITAPEVPDLILAAIPSLRDEWPEIEEENADPDSPGGRLGYLGPLSGRYWDAVIDFWEKGTPIPHIEPS